MFSMVLSSVLIIMILILTFCALYKREVIEIFMELDIWGKVIIKVKKDRTHSKNQESNCTLEKCCRY